MRVPIFHTLTLVSVISDLCNSDQAAAAAALISDSRRRRDRGKFWGWRRVVVGVFDYVAKKLGVSGKSGFGSPLCAVGGGACFVVS